jgi:hypothetical protein
MGLRITNFYEYTNRNRGVLGRVSYLKSNTPPIDNEEVARAFTLREAFGDTKRLVSLVATFCAEKQAREPAGGERRRFEKSESSS